MGNAKLYGLNGGALVNECKTDMVGKMKQNFIGAFVSGCKTEVIVE